MVEDQPRAGPSRMAAAIGARLVIRERRTVQKQILGKRRSLLADRSDTRAPVRG